MSKQDVRQPKQKRSIEKKKRIIRASYKLFCSKGYYQTNTAEIAKEAGVSTGIVYSYFVDKKAILLEVIDFYIHSLLDQLQPLLNFPIEKQNIQFMINQFIDITVLSHTMDHKVHNEFLALSLLEPEVLNLFNNFEIYIIDNLANALINAGFSEQYLIEKIRICYGMVEQISHNYIQKNETLEELEVKKKIAASTIAYLLNDSGM